MSQHLHRSLLGAVSVVLVMHPRILLLYAANISRQNAVLGNLIASAARGKATWGLSVVVICFFCASGAVRRSDACPRGAEKQECGDQKWYHEF
ncbi:hypothetical protein MFRU_008g03130 [Monilinia fructicola]|nr:hypothetical protein MFRU_008g03130 [Monilinia fructicola]